MTSPSAAPLLAALAAASLAGCGDAGSDRSVPDLRAKIEAQSADLQDLRKEVGSLRAQVRLLEERAEARTAGGAAPAPAVAKAPEDPAAEEAADATPAPSTPTEESVVAFLGTPEGQKRLELAVDALEKRRQEAAAQERRERIKSMIEERVKTQLTERLGLDAQQQQSMIRIISDAMERSDEVWSAMRDGRNDPAAMTQAREKSQQIRQDAMTQAQQALTVDQYNKLQDTMAEGGMGIFGGGRGGFGAGGGGAAAPGGAR